jgi:hypothetical protein
MGHPCVSCRGRNPQLRTQLMILTSLPMQEIRPGKRPSSAAWNYGPPRSASSVFRHPDVTSNLAPTIKISDHCHSGGSGQSSKAQPNSFVVKILTSKPLGLKILHTVLCKPRAQQAFQSMGGRGRGNQTPNLHLIVRIPNQVYCTQKSTREGFKVSEFQGPEPTA